MGKYYLCLELQFTSVKLFKFAYYFILLNNWQSTQGLHIGTFIVIIRNISILPWLAVSSFFLIQGFCFYLSVFAYITQVYHLSGTSTHAINTIKATAQ